MKKILLLFIIINIHLLNSQITYIIPDIGTPGMSTYTEIIGPANIANIFGNDGLYVNSNELHIVFENPSDSKKLEFGPLIVTWNGRMIATQVFVNPNLKPNSSCWDSLTSEFRIAFRIGNQITVSNIDTFYIVKPYNLTNLSSNPDRTFGKQSLGVRSRRGAMIVDSLDLANSSYGVSMLDCDPYTAGNQAYLPFILLSKKNITGGNNTVIHVDAIGKNGGPGGGGGGGRFCDGTLLNPLIGEDGGDGFTGGGAGGRNNSFGTSNLWKNAGNSTGSSGNSLNGVAPPNNSWYESSGGGTGHPFGFSGWSCGDGNNCDPLPGYGGGSGYRQNSRGGSGGYRSDGDKTGTQNGGKTHGNIDGVPIGGGSGGASGNPNSANECSGNGGGGGGAIRIFANKISNVSVSANGADGGTSSYSQANGGAGSGGYITLEGKLSVSDAAESVVGGNTGLGGYGYAKVESPQIQNLNIFPTTLTANKGITTDTSKYVRQKFILTGSCNTIDDSLLIYIKPESGFWTLDTILTGLKGKTLWSSNITLSLVDSIFYIVAIHDRGYGIENAHDNVVRYTTSQSAANILIRYGFPSISGDTVKNHNLLGCPLSGVLDSANITNKGDAPLILDFTKASFANGIPGFALVKPLSLVTVQPGDTAKVFISYTYKLNDKGFIRDTLLIPHNDINAKHNPWRIAYNIEIDTISSEITDENFHHVDTFNFGKKCINDIYTIKGMVVDKSTLSFTVSLTDFTDSLNFGLTTNFNDIIDTQNPLNFTASFKPVKKGKFSTRIILTNELCNSVKDTMYFTGEGINAEFFIEEPLLKKIDTLNLGKICVGTTRDSNFLIRNNSGDDLTFNYIPQIVNPQYKTDISQPGIIPDKSWDSIYISLTPFTEGKISETVYITTNACNGNKDSIIIVADGIKSSLSFTGQANFGVVKLGGTNSIEFILKNTGTADEKINSIKPLTLPFKLISITPSLPVLLNPNDELKIQVSFSPLTKGFYPDSIEAVLFQQLGTCPDSAKLKITGIGSNDTLTASTDSLDFGVQEYCHPKEESFFIINPFLFDLKILYWNFIGSDSTFFTLAQPPKTTILHPNDTAFFILKFSPRWGPDGLRDVKFVVHTDVVSNPEIIVKLHGEQENNKITFTPPGLNFGSVPLGIVQSQDILLTNPGKIDRQLIQVTSTNNDYTFINTAGLIFAGGGIFKVTVNYKPTVAGNEDAPIIFEFRQNCYDTLKAIMTAEGREGNVLITPQVDFPLNNPCSNLIDSIVITNTGASKITVDSIFITGQDSIYFDIKDALTYPIILDSGFVKIIKIGFKPGMGGYGIKKAEINYIVDIGGKKITVKTNLNAERKNFIQITPQSLSFSPIITGSSSMQGITIKNIGNLPFKITKPLLPLNPLVFTFLPDPTGTNLNPGASIFIRFTFSPSEIKTYKDLFGIEVDYYGCLDSAYIDLAGRGIPPLHQVIWIPDTTADPKINTFNIPIYGKLKDTGLSMVISDFTAEISFNFTMYFPKKLSGGSILRDTIDYNKNLRYILFKLDPVYIDDSSRIITEIQGRPLLGNSDTTTLKWESIKFSPGDSIKIASTNILNGMLRTLTCAKGGTRLLKPGLPLNLKITPNPAHDKLTADINILEIGKHTLELIDMQGQKLILKEVYINIDDNKELSFDIDISKFSSGVYFIVLSSPTDKKVEPVFIIK